MPQEDLNWCLTKRRIFEIPKHAASKFLLTPASFFTKGDKQVLAARAEPQSANLTRERGWQVSCPAGYCG